MPLSRLTVRRLSSGVAGSSMLLVMSPRKGRVSRSAIMSCLRPSKRSPMARNRPVAPFSPLPLLLPPSKRSPMARNRPA